MSCAVGDLVQCRVVANWVLQRHPLRVCDVELLSWSTLASVPGTGDPKYVAQHLYCCFHTPNYPPSHHT